MASFVLYVTEGRVLISKAFEKEKLTETDSTVDDAIDTDEMLPGIGN